MVEEVEDLDRQLAPDPKPIAEVGCCEKAGGIRLREIVGDPRHLGDRAMKEEVIVHRLRDLAGAGKGLAGTPDMVFGARELAPEVADTRWPEAILCEERSQELGEQSILVAQDGGVGWKA